MIVLNQLLCEAIVVENEDAIRNLTSQILNLIQSEQGYLQQLSEPVFKNTLVAAMLVEQNELLFGYLDQTLQNNQALRAQAKLQNLFGAYHDESKIKNGSEMTSEACLIARQYLPQQYQNEPGLAAPKPNTYHQSMANFLRIKAFIALLTPKALTQSEFIAHVHDLNPGLLLKVINYRKANKLPALPFFDNDKLCKELEEFNLDITTRLAPDWNQNYLSIKRRACEQENFAFIHDPYAIKNAVTFLSKTDTWFSGFNQYHVYQSSYERLWARLMIMMKALYRTIIPLAKVGLALAAIWYAYPVLKAIIATYFWQGLLTSLCLSLLNLGLKNSLISTVNDILWRAIWLDFDLYIAAISTIIYQSAYILVALYNTLDGALAMLGVIPNAVLYFINKNEYTANTLENACENTVIRLDGMNETSAQGKGEILKGLLTQVKAEMSSEPGHSFKELLDKKYTIAYQGRTHDVSFSEVASKHRAHNGEFKLDDQPDRMRFFRGRTTTEILLATVEPVLGVAP